MSRLPRMLFVNVYCSPYVSHGRDLVGGHLPIGKEFIYPVVSTCPPSERCTIYPVPTILKPDICETVIDTLWI